MERIGPWRGNDRVKIRLSLLDDDLLIIAHENIGSDVKQAAVVVSGARTPMDEEVFKSRFDNAYDDLVRNFPTVPVAIKDSTAWYCPTTPNPVIKKKRDKTVRKQGKAR
jgi:hypothetical protein